MLPNPYRLEQGIKQRENRMKKVNKGPKVNSDTVHGVVLFACFSPFLNRSSSIVIFWSSGSLSLPQSFPHCSVTNRVHCLSIKAFQISLDLETPSRVISSTPAYSKVPEFKMKTHRLLVGMPELKNCTELSLHISLHLYKHKQALTRISNGE